MSLPFEYVLSGMRYTVGPVYNYMPEVQEFYQKFFNKKSNDIEITCLYNAFSEKSLGKVLSEDFKLPKIYSDSGGLQMALYGDGTDSLEAREKIYKVQSDYSNLAFCFDDIPLKMTSVNASARVLVNNKYFEKNLLKEKAIKTADNIKEQIKYFANINAKTKIFAIIQGNCAKTFTEWGNYLFNHLTDSEKEYVFGIALADTCAGNGILESVEMTKALINIECPERIKKNVHYLGIGSITRMMPIIELSHTPLLKNTHISFDSTSHTSSFAMGKYFDENNKSKAFGKTANNLNIQVVEGIIDKYFPDQKKSEMSKIILENIGNFIYLREKTELQPYLVSFMAAYVFEMVEIFTKSIKAVYNDYNEYSKFVRNNKLLMVMSSLRNMKTIEELDEWAKRFAYLIPSNSIASNEPASLKELF